MDAEKRIIFRLRKTLTGRRRIAFVVFLSAFSIFATVAMFTMYFSSGSPITVYPSFFSGKTFLFQVRSARTVPYTRDCGPWQKPYRELHKRIIAREAPQRYVTWRCNPDFSTRQYEAAWCGGLRDRTFGIVNAFLYAILNDRAFLMDSKFPAPWEDLMDSPNGIEWQYTGEREQYINTLNHTEVIYQIGNPHDPFDKHDEIKDYQNVILQGDRFVGYDWIKANPRARELGIPAEGGFACIIDYLFTPSHMFKHKMQPYLDALDERNSLAIGVAIRYPDTFILGPDAKDEGALEGARKILTCALEVYSLWEPWTRPRGVRFVPRPLIIFLLTNSAALRREARAAYPGKVVAGEWPFKHIDSKETTWETAWPSIAENWIFAETRFKLIQEGSRGFSRLAASRAWWKYHHTMPWVRNDTDCLASDLFRQAAYWTVEW